MATPVTTVDGTTVYNAANMNKYLTSDGTKTTVKVWHARVRYNGVSLVVESTVDSAGITSGALAFNAGTTAIEITLSGFTNPPVAVLTPTTATAYTVKPTGMSNVLATIQFFDIDTGAQIVTGALDTDMDFQIMIIGE